MSRPLPASGPYRGRKVPRLALGKKNVEKTAKRGNAVARDLRRATLRVLFCVGIIANISHSGTAVAAKANDWDDFGRFVGDAQALMMAHPDGALNNAIRAAAIAGRHRNTPRYSEAMATALWLKAEALTRTGDI